MHSPFESGSAGPSRIEGWHPRIPMKLATHKPPMPRSASKKGQAAGAGAQRERPQRQRATSRPIRLEADARKGTLSMVCVSSAFCSMLLKSFNDIL